MNQLFSEENWPIVQQKIEDKLHQFGIDKQRIREELERNSAEDPTEEEPDDVAGVLGQGIKDH
jgi:SOS response regulatory protein OraA/RecX